MTEDEERILLKKVLLDAAEKEFAEDFSNNEPVSATPNYRRQMIAMQNDPMKWAARRKRPAWKRFVKMVATILLTISLSLGALVAVSPTVRAAVIEWLVEWYEGSVIYRFFGEPDFSEMPVYEISNLPSGYEQVDVSYEEPNEVEINYENANGDIITFEYMRVEDGSAIIVSTEDMKITEVFVGDNLGHLYVSEDNQQSSLITWYDEAKEIQFMIDGYLSDHTLLEMANSVSEK